MSSSSVGSHAVARSRPRMGTRASRHSSAAGWGRGVARTRSGRVACGRGGASVRDAVVSAWSPRRAPTSAAPRVRGGGHGACRTDVRERQIQRERASLARCARELDLATKQRGQLPADGETQACSGHAGVRLRRSAHEPGKDLFTIFRGNSFTFRCTTETLYCKKISTEH